MNPLPTALILFLLSAGSLLAQTRQPNVVWIVVEDMSDHFSCYGETTIQTPNVDQLAEDGTLFENAFVTCPVCSPSRSAMITGMYQTTIGAHNHRSGRGYLRIHLPEHIQTIPAVMKEAGYYVTNGGLKPNPKRPDAIAKTDYNFETPDDLYDGNDWRNRAEGQPFFAQYQLSGGKNRSVRVKGQGVAPETIPSPEKVALPPYYPDDAVLREDWADYLAAVLKVDQDVSEIMDQLEAEGVLENTLVIFFTDHGISHARGKQFLYEEGIKVPLIVRGPGIDSGERREDLVAHIDIAATTLQAAGVEIPEWMEARPLFGEREARDYVVSARDRCDETIDRIRSVRTERFKYIRNFYPDRPHLQGNAYKDHKAIIQRLRELNDAGALNELQASLFKPRRPVEEFYDLENDPWETKNLARDPAFREEFRRHRRLLENWIVETQDAGQAAEDPKAYASDMEEYIKGKERKGQDNVDEFRENIEQQKRWVSQGK